MCLTVAGVHLLATSKLRSIGWFTSKLSIPLWCVQKLNVRAKAENQREVAASAAPTLAPQSLDLEVERLQGHGEEPLSEAQNFDLQMPDMSKVCQTAQL